IYTEGFSAGMARYGSLLDTLECQFVRGYTYISPRPLGAPPDAKGAPPKLLFKLLLKLHPALRKRVARAEQVWCDKPWRDDARAFFEHTLPEATRPLSRAAGRGPARAGRPAADRASAGAARSLSQPDAWHFRDSSATMLPVGDYVVHTMDWTGCSREEALEPLSGHSPWSVEVMKELDAVAAAVTRSDAARSLLTGDAPAAERLQTLRDMPGEVGAATRHWLERVGQRIVTGHDVSELRGIEMPHALLRSLAARIEDGAQAQSQSNAAADALRARVPEPARATWDGLLAEARLVHPLRDGHSVIDFWAFGLVRRGLLEAGRRLVERGALQDPEHVVPDPRRDQDAARDGRGPGCGRRRPPRRRAAVDPCRRHAGHTGLTPLVEAEDEARFGGKAVQLGAALRAGLPVPAGFALDVALVDAIVAGDAAAHTRAAASLDALPARLPSPTARASASTARRVLRSSRRP
ncbi:MAG: hypothetical protein OXT09_35115, partial [Myxococcales bacterium]|nr:hypothetical protein [Myxococcales bacterium]